jgi:enoyl-CoA hydratase
MFDVEVVDGVARISFSGRVGSMFTEVVELARGITEDDNVRAVLVSGWSVPLDRQPEPVTGPTVAAALLRREEEARAMMRSWSSLDKPVVAAVDADSRVPTFILMADIVVAEDQVSFWDFHVPNGVMSATQPFLWPLSAGLAKARRYILTGDKISAAEAERIGLIAEVVETGQSYARAMEYASKLAGYRPETLQLTKRALNQWQQPLLTPVFEHALAMEFLTMPESIGGHSW